MWRRLGFAFFSVVNVCVFSTCSLNDADFRNATDPLYNLLLFDCSRYSDCKKTDEGPRLPVDGAVLWFRADQGLDFNGSTWIWRDLSGNGNQARGTITGLSAAGIGGRPALAFSENNSERLSTAPVTLGAFTVFNVLRISSTSALALGIIYEFTADTNTGYGFYFSIGISNTIFANNGGTSSGWNQSSATWAKDDVARIATMRMDGTHAGHSLRLNGVAAAPNQNQTGNPGTNSITANFFMGNRGDISQNFPIKGDFAEIIVYSRSLSDAERNTVECYLSGYYAISVTGC